MIVLKTFERSARLAELKVSYKRRQKAEPGQVRMPWVCSTPQTAEEYLRSVWDKDRIEYAEDFVVLCLNNAIEPIGWVRVATGGLDYAAVDPRIVFAVRSRRQRLGSLSRITTRLGRSRHRQKTKP